VKSFETRIKEVSEDVARIEFLMLNYGLSLQYGIKPANIPFTPVPPFRGGKSKYIEGLIRWAKLKFGADKQRAKSIAFAIANKHKKEGYPLTKKIGFITNVLEADKEKINNIIEDYFEAVIEALIDEYLSYGNN